MIEAVILVTLAQQDDPRADMLDVGVWLVVLGAILLLGTALVFWIRKRTMASQDPAPSEDAPFTLAEIRRMHRQGQISDEEYHKARAALIAQYGLSVSDLAQPSAADVTSHPAQSDPQADASHRPASSGPHVSSGDDLPDDASSSGDLSHDASSSDDLPDGASSSDDLPNDTSSDDDLPNDTSSDDDLPDDASSGDDLPDDASSGDDLPDDWPQDSPSDDDAADGQRSEGDDPANPPG